MASTSKEKIGVITTVSNWDLYKKTNHFFPGGVKIFAIDGTKNFYGLQSLLFFIEKLKKYELDWIIMADEDVIFKNPDKVFDLIEYLSYNDFTVCGMRDGGTLNWRNQNPYAINHFFAILHLKEIYKIYNRNEILKNQYILKDEFSENIHGVSFRNYDVNSLFETYYCFYLWLLRKNKKFYYLEGSNPIEGDFATTLLFDHAGSPLLYHTWYARFYRKDKYHTRRIDNVINREVKICQKDLFDRHFILLPNTFNDMKFFFYRFSRRIIRKFKSFNLD